MRFTIPLFLTMLMASVAPVQAAGGHGPEPAYPELADGSTQYAAFPKPKETYEKVEGGLIETLKSRAAQDPFNVAATIIFILAICHTFAAGSLNKLAHHHEHIHQENLRTRGPGIASIPMASRRSLSARRCITSSARWRRFSGSG